MKLRLTAVSVVLYCFCGYAQQELSLQQWQKAHPEITFISEKKWNNLSDEERNLLGNKYIVYSDDMTFEEVKSQIKSNSTPNVPFSYDDPNAQLIKDWLGENSNVTVLRGERTKEDSLDLYRPNTLVYFGEFLTLNDIQNYEQ